MVGRQFGSRRLAPAMSYNPLDDVPLSIRSGAKSRPSPEGVAPSSAMDFPSQFSDADFEGTVTIRTWEHGTHQRQGRLKGNASVTSFTSTSTSPADLSFG